MYSLTGYGSMMADRVRMDAYRAALRRAIHPGSIVLDLGAGPAIMSCIAAQLGAAKIYAIEPDASLELGRAIARANGFENRIEIYREFSNSVNLPERADVIVADMRGVLPAFGGHFRAIADARDRFLKPGGTLIPQCDTLWVALAEEPKKYDDLVGGWNAEGLDLSIGRRMIANTWSKTHLAVGQLLSPPLQWAEVDYRKVVETALAGRVQTEVARTGLVHGLCVWFDADLLDGIGFSNAPGQPEAIYGQAFFPLLGPIPVECGDRVDIALRADLTGDDYTWSWHTTIYSAAGQTKADYTQSTFLGVPLSAQILRKRADSFVPTLTEDARIDANIIELMSSGLNLRDIASQISTQYPARFPNWKAVLNRVAALSSRYSE